MVKSHYIDMYAYISSNVIIKVLFKYILIVDKIIFGCSILQDWRSCREDAHKCGRNKVISDVALRQLSFTKEKETTFGLFGHCHLLRRIVFHDSRKQRIPWWEGKS